MHQHELQQVVVYQGKYTQAEPLYERAVSIREQVLEPNHPSVTESLNNMAWLYLSYADFACVKS